jgi:hypothetical protein
VGPTARSLENEAFTSATTEAGGLLSNVVVFLNSVQFAAISIVRSGRLFMCSRFPYNFVILSAIMGNKISLCNVFIATVLYRLIVYAIVNLPQSCSLKLNKDNFMRERRPR